MIRFLSRVQLQELEGVAIVRLDFNTKDAWRMEAALPTLKFLLKARAVVVILGHRGRPEGVKIKNGMPIGFSKDISLRHDAGLLSRMIRKKVVFISHFRFGEIKKKISRAKAGSVFLLENLRFLKGEEENSSVLAKQLASLGDYFVNDAFAVSHRADASVAAITRFFPSYAGFGLENELRHLGHVMKRPKRPLAMVFGGAKAHEKITVIHYFRKKADVFILGGALSNSVLKFNGVNIGSSIYDAKVNPQIYEIIKFKNLFLPLDYEVKENKIEDLGPKTIRMMERKIKTAKTIIWNGPLGRTEEKPFERSTLALAKAIAKNKKALSLAGGGETVMFLKKYRLDKKFSFISTGGGAMLDFLAGKKLPGIEALKNSR